MHIRVYGVQPDELPIYKKAEETYGFTFEFADEPLTAANADKTKGCEGLVILTNCAITEEVAAILEKQGVKYIAARSAGADHIDLEAAHRHNLKCANVPFYAPEAISEHTILMALLIIRNWKKSTIKIAGGDYTMAGLKGRQLGQMRAGVFGTGRIGRTTMQILKGFGAEIVGADPYPNKAAEELCTYVSNEELLKTSDIVFLHCPLTDDNYHLINAETIAMMKDGAYLVNTARGGLVDYAAVLEALKSGKLAGFSFDVYENESAFVRKKKTMEEINDPIFQELISRPDVNYSAHVAFFTDGAVYSMIDVSLQNLKEYETTGACKNEVKAFV